MLSLQQIKRRLFTRCAGCGGWSTKDNPVNTRIGNPVSAPQKPWDSEVGLFHGQCASDASRASRRLDAQRRAEPHWAVYTFASLMADRIDRGQLDRSEVSAKLREVADQSKAEFGKIIEKGQL